METSEARNGQEELNIIVDERSRIILIGLSCPKSTGVTPQSSHQIGVLAV